MLILAAILAIFVYGLIAAMLGTLLPELSAKFSLTPGQNGDIALAQAIGLIVASVAVGPLIDLKGKKTGLLLGMGLIAAALFVVPNVPGGVLSPVFLALGVGGGIIVTAANALVSDISETRRASTLNLLNLFFGLGGLVTPLIASDLLAHNTVALCYLVAVLAVLTFVLHAVTKMPKPTGVRGFKMDEVGPLLSRPVLYLLALLLFLYVACEVGVWNWLPLLDSRLACSWDA
jgi:fucose permease